MLRRRSSIPTPSVRGLTLALLGGAALALLWWLTNVPAYAADARRPNILFVLTDDQAASDMRFMERTQRLLGERGVTFRNMFTPFPLCAPNRMSILTGEYPHNHHLSGDTAPQNYQGVDTASRRNLLGSWMQRAGYRTGYIGKYLNGYGESNQKEVPPGWNRWFGGIDVSTYDTYNFLVNDQGRVRSYGDRAYAEGLQTIGNREWNGKLNSPLDLLGSFNELFRTGWWGTTDYSRYSADVYFEQARAFIRDGVHKRSQPWFLHIAPPLPHREDVNDQRGYVGLNPRVPPRYEAKAKSLVLPHPAGFDEADVSAKPREIRALPQFDAQRLTHMSNEYQGRGGSLLAIDEWVGKLVSTLRTTGQLKDTVVIFTSDNGWLQGQHRLPGDKYVPYEQSLRVPMIMSGPGIPRGRSTTALTTSIDLAPTILGLAGAHAGRTLDGGSLLPVIRGRRIRTSFPIEATRRLLWKPGFASRLPYDQPYYGVRTATWKYVKWSYGDEELYDLKADPSELHNLAALPAYAGRKAELAKLASARRACRGAKACGVLPARAAG